MSSTTDKNEVVSSTDDDTQSLEELHALMIWDIAFAAGRNVGYKQGVDACRFQLLRTPTTPPAPPEEQEKNAAVPLTTSIDELGPRTRTWNILKSEGITTIGDILMRSEANLSEIRNLGPKGIDEIDAKLAELGYTIHAS